MFNYININKICFFLIINLLRVDRFVHLYLYAPPLNPLNSITNKISFFFGKIAFDLPLFQNY